MTNKHTTIQTNPMLLNTKLRGQTTNNTTASFPRNKPPPLSPLGMFMTLQIERCKWLSVDLYIFFSLFYGNLTLAELIV